VRARDLDDLARSHGLEQAGGSGGFDAYQPRAVRDVVPRRCGRQRADADRDECDVDAGVAGLLVDLAEDRRVALDDIARDLLVSRPLRV
jgi:hypothetical protein